VGSLADLFYGLLVVFLTVAVTIFIAELTDKDALLLMTLATRFEAWTAFAAGATAFTISTGIIVTIGYFLVKVAPIFWIKLGGGVVMIGFALWDYFRKAGEEEEELLKRRLTRTGWNVFLTAVSLLILLDLAGDATEVLTIVYVARFSNVTVVFLGCVTALYAASAVETFIGNRLRRILTPNRIRIFSLLVFLVIGSVIIVTTIL
jgi:putative Ca2+/H+ antiporter (TMEM165/GDT1 family)